MAYYDLALLAADGEFSNRVAACYATETLDVANADNPLNWALTNAWEMASAPGFSDAYASALAAGNPSPGTDPAVITDPMILSAVQHIMTTERR